MNYNRERAKVTWIFSFGDLITLLVTLFILILVLNKGEITKIQKWSEDELDATAFELEKVFADFKYLSVFRVAQGIEVNISANNSFIKGGFVPLPELSAELERLGIVLDTLPFLTAKNGAMPKDISRLASKNNFVLYREISISGHTDNDVINPGSNLRNNWFLSAMRAQTVMKLLFNYSSLPADKFSISGFGEYRPIASNRNELEKIKNRRVNILIVASFQKGSAENLLVSNQ